MSTRTKHEQFLSCCLSSCRLLIRHLPSIEAAAAGPFENTFNTCKARKNNEPRRE